MSTRKRRQRRTKQQIVEDLKQQLAAKEAELELADLIADRPDLEHTKAILRELNQFDKKVSGEHRDTPMSLRVLQFRTELVGLWTAAGFVVPSTRNRALGTGSGKIVPIDDKPKKKPSRKKKRTLRDV